MTWVKLDDGFDEHPKVVSLSDRAFRSYIEAVCWSARWLSNGKLPKGITDRHGQKVVEELREAGLLDLTDGEYTIHDYLTYNPSKEKVIADREAEHIAKVEAGRIGAAKRWHSTGDSTGDSRPNGRTDSRPIADPKQNDSPVPVPLPEPLPQPVPEAKTLAPRKRDALFEVVAEVCEIDWQNGMSHAGRSYLNAAVAELRPLNPSPEEVRRRAANWSYDTKLTPSTLAKRWGELDKPPTGKPRRDRAAEIAAGARLARDAGR